jgi:hypothetical protein
MWGLSVSHKQRESAPLLANQGSSNLDAQAFKRFFQDLIVRGLGQSRLPELKGIVFLS